MSDSLEEQLGPGGRAARERATRAALAGKDSDRRRMVDPVTTDKEYSAAEAEFVLAMGRYKTLSGRNFPTNSEVLEVLHSLGYRKVAPAGPLPCEK